MTDDELREHAAHVTSLQQMEHGVALAQARARRWIGLAVASVCVVVLAALLVLGLVLRDKSSADETNGHRIEELTTELREARLLIESNRAEDQAKSDCATTLGVILSRALSDYLATLGDLIVTISTVVPGPDREQAVATSIEQLRVELVAYRGIVRIRSEWDAAGSPLPCPTPPGGS